ncbi:MAG TPA: flagellar basal-body MS-ring/collar protein FliF [Noviherbaspirillum sp.]|nr:flagellar basal-body MS-ring/collar protein FliF [Noviherbaspirillum sp.]
MSVAGETATAPTGLVGFAQTPGGRNFFLMLGVAAVLAVMSVIWMWSKEPDYRVLFSNFSDRDGGAIVAALQQMNVPYKFADGGGAILVPSSQVHDVRLRLASQGLPKGGNVGFELMENQRLGVSQFLEQVNFQRALEGELARSIQSVAAVQAARVHLALPKNSVFVRDQQKPTASVLLNLHPGRSLDEQQVSAIVHLVASSVPELPTKNVTVVDQNGNLLSDKGKKGANTLDPTQLKYVQELQQSIVRRIESIITPIVGPGNVRAEATADVDFSHTEQAAEIYTPNQAPGASAIRSQQSSESRTTTPNGAVGVPGALTNQPPAPATAPIVADAAATAPGAAPAAAPAPTNEQRDTTVNYEVDKTVRYVQQPMGGIRRLSVAVVVNFKRDFDAEGKPIMRALSDDEKNQITDLVREAMGFNRERGDSLNVVNSPFAGVEPEVIEQPPLWKRPEMLDLGMTAGRYMLGGILLLYLYFAFLRPLIRRIMKTFEPPQQPPAPQIEEDAVVQIEHEPAPMGSRPRTYQDNLDAAKELARKDPKMVANVVKSWVGNE